MKGYNHKLDNILEACGYTEEYVKNLQMQMKMISLKEQCVSREVEEYEKAFTRKELAYALIIQRFNFHHQIEEMEAKAAEKVIKDMFRSLKES